MEVMKREEREIINDSGREASSILLNTMGLHFAFLFLLSWDLLRVFFLLFFLSKEWTQDHFRPLVIYVSIHNIALYRKL